MARLRQIRRIQEDAMSKKTVWNKGMKTRTVEGISMLTRSLAITLLIFAALGGNTSAQSISWTDKGTHIISGNNWYRPKIAADFDGDVVVMGLVDGTTLGPMDYWTGLNPMSETSLDGVDHGFEITTGGFAPSVAMLQSTTSVFPNLGGIAALGAVIDAHQGGQHGGAALFSGFAEYGGYPIGTTLKFVGGQEYDIGYHPSVAIDPNFTLESTSESEIPQAIVSTVVEVHQAAGGISDLWYHVGTIAIWVDGSGVPSSLKWGPSHQLNSAEGSFPSVTVCNGEVIEVHEGTSETLLYTVGTVSGDVINWSPTLPYDKGYHPSLTSDCTHVVEAHQAGAPAGEPTALWYHAANFPPPSSAMDFGPSRKYDEGCSPSVAFAYAGYYGEGSPGPEDIVETHTMACGETTALEFDYGLFLP
jgi:hypothetical protein